MEVGPNGKTRWCPIEYEFLPNFCYICGLLGHIDRECSKGSWREKRKPFGPELRVWPSRRRLLENTRNQSREGRGSGESKGDKDNNSGSKLSWRELKKSDQGSTKPTFEMDKGGEAISLLKSPSLEKRDGLPQ